MTDNEGISLKQHLIEKIDDSQRQVIDRVIAVRDSLQDKITSIQSLLETKLIEVEKATRLAATSIDKRLENMNEFRASLKDQAALFATRQELVTFKERTEQDIQQLMEGKVTIDQKINGLERTTVAYNASLDKRLETMNEFREALKDQATHFMNKEDSNQRWARNDEDIRMLRESKALLEGKASQNAVNIATIIGIVAIIASFINGILTFITKP
jgi:vacuolar-type H+-ATPase subunit I/STV1